MPKLTYKCPACGKALKLAQELKIGDTLLYEYTCGHVFSKILHDVDTSTLDFTCANGTGKVARDYQKRGVEFILQTDFNCIIADQMRLGKTPQSLLALKNALAERTPVLILVKSANLWQWVREFKTWTTTLPNGIFPILSTKAWIPHGFSAYIISMDTFSREKIRESLKTIQFKLIIVDEAHSFKNTESNRSQALVDFVAFMNTGEESLTLNFTCARCNHEWTEEGKHKWDKRIGASTISKSSKCKKCGQWCFVSQSHDDTDKPYVKDPKALKQIEACERLASDQSTTEHERKQASDTALALRAKYELPPKPKEKACGLVLLTGTPILNRADEYFVPLNLINPERFSSLEQFRRTWLEQDEKGRWTRVKRYYLDAFKELIKPIILRREKEDVYTDLPELNKIYTLIEPDKASLADKYNKILDKMELKLAEKANPSYWDMADELMELRRICGMMKLMWTADYLETCAMESNAKYAIGIHHESVRDVLYMKLGGEKNCVRFSGETNKDLKDQIMQKWEHWPQQFLIINMLAGGVGCDFHYCDNVLVLERQWNSGMEEQFEFRFYNPDKSIKKNPTNVEYILAKGTLDEWWHDMVEEKRKVFGETVANHWDLQKDSTSFIELAERTVAGRL